MIKDQPIWQLIARSHQDNVPTAIPKSLFKELAQADLSGGLNQWFRQNPQWVKYLEVTDPHVTQDIDSPSDLA